MEELGETREFAPFAKQILKQGWVKPNKRIFDNSKISDHFAIIPTLQTPAQLNEAEQKLYDLVVRRFLAVFYPAAEYLQTTRITHVRRAQFRTDGKVLKSAGLARGLRQSRRRGEREPAGDRAGREGPGARDRRARQPDAAAAALHRGDAALGDGRRRQAGRGRRAARRDGGQGPGHAGDARRDHRGPDPRGIRASRGPRAGADAEGVLADVRAAHAAHRRARLARAHRRMGAQAEADRGGQADARRVHGRRSGAGEERGEHHQARRDPGRRLRHGARAVPEMRRRGAGELPQGAVPEMRLHALAGDLRPRVGARGARRAVHQALRRSAHRLSQQAGPAVQRRYPPDG